MPKINQYTDNSTIEDTDAMLTYDPSNGGSTKLTTFARIASWMSAKLAALAKKTAITSADQILMVNGSATARIDYNVLAKAIIEQYAGSTLVGSAQSIQAALMAVNNNLTNATSGFSPEIVTDLDSFYDNMESNRASYCRYAKNCSNAPRNGNGSGLCMTYKISANYGMQYAYDDVWTYYRSRANGVWGEWEKTPTRTEINKMGILDNQYFYYAANSAGTYTYTLGSASLYLVAIAKINASSNSIGLYIANSYNADSGFLLKEIISIGTNLAEIALQGNTLTITTKNNHVSVGITRIA